MKYIVCPAAYRKGFCRTVCRSMESAEKEKKKLEVLTGFEWEITKER